MHRPPRSKTPKTPSAEGGVGFPSVAEPSSARHNRSNNRSSTPPRRGADPGTAVDHNFVSDDWDDEDDQRSSRRARSNRHSEDRDTDRNHPTKPGQVITGVKADDNWLDEDFDS
jgi:hypothetical protein